MKQSSVFMVDENDDVKTCDSPNKKAKMFNICKEFCFVLAIIFTAYATIINSQNWTKKRPPPIPFFHRGSVVDDFYQGDLVQLMHQVSGAGLAFVMFYAPWDADSQDARSGFEEAAKFYYNQIYFAGVNCWEPGSECRSTFKDITSFPQLIAYNGPRKAIEYRGPYDADHMIHFVHSLLNPLHRVNTVSDVLRLRYLNHALVVGHLKFSGVFGGAPYQALYETSLRFAGRDHQRHTAFAVFTHDKINPLMDIYYTPTVVLYLWDKKMIYDGEINSDSLYKWVLMHTSKNLAVINSNTLLPHVKSGAVMVMFTPRHPLTLVNPYYQMLRRIAIKFNGCGNSSGLVQDDFLSQMLNHEDLYKHFEQEILRGEKVLREECALLRKPKFEPCMAVSPRPWNNMTCYETLNSCFSPGYKQKLKVIGKRGEDWRSAKQLILSAKEERCRLLARAPHPLSPRPSRHPLVIPSACQINTTLSFLVLDSQRHSHLARGLGIDLKRRKHNSAVIIFTREETLQLDTEEVSEETAAALLNAYVSGNKNRFLRSARLKMKPDEEPKDTEVSVLELNTRTFHRTILNETQHVVVLYHSPYCSFCHSVSHVFLTVAYLLKGLPRIVMARVDGENNDLPWQYTVHSYPSVLIFPAHGKSESRIFPQWLALTMHSLSNFILANLPVEERIQGMLALCAKWGNKPEVSNEGERCLHNVRISCLEMISETLHQYRSASIRLRHTMVTDHRKHLRSILKKLLIRLQYLKSAHISLERVLDIENVLLGLQKIQRDLTNKKILKNIRKYYLKDEL